jgi:hypothetical protein
LPELIEPATQITPMPLPTTQAKLPELVEPAAQTMPMPPPATQVKPPLTQNKPGLQYHYQATVEDQHLISELQAWLLDGKLIQTTLAHILAASPQFAKSLSSGSVSTGLKSMHSKALLSQILTCPR